ncbi:MAG: hypothetical protein AAGU75_13370 [Bacillota bacterium]
MQKFKVTYLEHSVFHDAERKTETMDRAELIALLQRGMVSILEVKSVPIGLPIQL